MATGEENSWWGSLVKSAKEKSISAFELMKNDLAEFTQTMTNDANTLLSHASSQLIEKSNSVSLLKNSDSDKINQATLAVAAAKKSDSSSFKTSTVQARYNDELEMIQKNEELYLNNDIESNEEFIQWIKCFNSDNYKSVISDLLIENSSMRLLYSQMVPAQISNHQFWSRYFFKVNQLEKEHKKRIKLLERAVKKSNDNVEDLTWENDDDDKEEEDNKNFNAISTQIKNEEQCQEISINQTIGVNNIEDKLKIAEENQETNDDSSQNQLGEEWEKVSDDNDNKLNEPDQVSNKKEDESNLKKDDWDEWDN